MEWHEVLSRKGKRHPGLSRHAILGVFLVIFACAVAEVAALRKAQLDLMNSSIQFRVARSPGGIIQSSISQPDIAIECSHPFFWAPFILVGDWK